MDAVVLQTAGIGDVLFTLPLVDALVESGRYANVVLVTTPTAAPLARMHSGLTVVVDDKRGRDRGARGTLRTAERLRRIGGADDHLFVAHRSWRSAAIALAAPGRRRLGFRDAEPLLPRLVYTDVVSPPARDVDRYLRLATAAGVRVPGRARLRLRIPGAQTARRAGTLPGAPPRLGLVVGSLRPTKDWPLQRLVEAVAGARPHGFGAVVLLGGPRERARAAALHAVAATAGIALQDATAESVPQTAATIAALDVVVGPDSGLTHLARAVGTPAVVLFGPTDEGRHDLARDNAVPALAADLDCRPCHHAGPRRCRRGDHACMAGLETTRVLAAAYALMARCTLVTISDTSKGLVT